MNQCACVYVCVFVGIITPLFITKSLYGHSDCKISFQFMFKIIELLSSLCKLKSLEVLCGKEKTVMLNLGDIGKEVTVVYPVAFFYNVPTRHRDLLLS